MMLIQHHESDYLLKRAIDQLRPALRREREAREDPARSRSIPTSADSRIRIKYLEADLRLREQARRRAALERRADPRLVPRHCQDRGRRIASAPPPKTKEDRRPREESNHALSRQWYAPSLRAAALQAAVTGLPRISRGNPPRSAVFHGLSPAQRDGASATHREARQGVSASTDVKVSWFTFNGPTARQRSTDLRQYRRRLRRRARPACAVVAHQRHAAGSARHFRAVARSRFLLNSRDPAIKTIKDFKDGDRIAVPAVQLIGAGDHAANGGSQGLWHEGIQQARPAHRVDDAAGRHGRAAQEAARRSSAAFSVPPFQYQQLEDPAVHTVLNSFDVMGGSHTFTAVWAPAKFRDGNPALYKALVAALKEATDIVNKDKTAAAALWIEDLEIETAARHGRQDRRRAAGALDHDPEKHREICRLPWRRSARSRRSRSHGRSYFFPEIHDERGVSRPAATHLMRLLAEAFD